MAEMNEAANGDDKCCAVCSSPTTGCCKACLNGIYVSSQAHKRRCYCSKDCQKKDWPAHKSHCKTVRSHVEIQALERATHFLQQAFYILRETTFELCIDSIKVKGNTLIVKEGAYIGPNKAIQRFYGFPPLDGQEAWVKPMLLTMMTCSDAVMALTQLVFWLLESTGVTSGIKEVSLKMKPGPRQWQFRRKHVRNIQSGEYIHAAYRITLQDRSMWALDLSCAQDGYETALMPWRDYEQTRVAQVNGVQSGGYSALMRFSDTVKYLPGDDEKTTIVALHKCEVAMQKPMIEALEALPISISALLRGCNTADYLEAIKAPLRDGQVAVAAEKVSLNNKPTSYFKSELQKHSTQVYNLA